MPDASATRDGALVGAAGAFTIGAGLVHATAAGGHAGLATAVGLFVAWAAVQVLLGVVLLVRPSRVAAWGAAAVNGAAAIAWAVSRTHGLPIDGFRSREAVGVQDLTATLIEVAAVVAVVAAFAARRPARARRLSPVLAIAMVPALIGMAAPHDHDEAAHTHDVAAGVEVAAGHSHGAASTPLAGDPIFAGADTSHATTAQLQAAKRLIDTTRAAVTAKFPDQASLIAAGYRSIGDGLVTQYDHYIKAEYLNDGRELDPDRVESIVMERGPDGWHVASAMYILEPGKTMADVPDVAGDLTTWHDHDNLCWDASGLRLAGILLNGKCFPGGTLKATPPMLHVWLADHDCGPFAGIEGHGGSCTHTHS